MQDHQPNTLESNEEANEIMVEYTRMSNLDIESSLIRMATTLWRVFNLTCHNLVPVVQLAVKLKNGTVLLVKLRHICTRRSRKELPK